jgi:hypothetical protein
LELAVKHIQGTTVLLDVLPQSGELQALGLQAASRLTCLGKVTELSIEVLQPTALLV